MDAIDRRGLQTDTAPSFDQSGSRCVAWSTDDGNLLIFVAYIDFNDQQK